MPKSVPYSQAVSPPNRSKELTMVRLMESRFVKPASSARPTFPVLLTMFRLKHSGAVVSSGLATTKKKLFPLRLLKKNLLDARAKLQAPQQRNAPRKRQARVALQRRKRQAKSLRRNAVRVLIRKSALELMQNTATRKRA